MRSAALTITFAPIYGALVTGQTRRAITLDDHSRMVSVGDPQRSPDSVWVAYTYLQPASTLTAQPRQ